jgi:hypothetical protein
MLRASFNSHMFPGGQQLFHTTSLLNCMNRAVSDWQLFAEKPEAFTDVPINEPDSRVFQFLAQVPVVYALLDKVLVQGGEWQCRLDESTTMSKLLWIRQGLTQSKEEAAESIATLLVHLGLFSAQGRSSGAVTLRRTSSYFTQLFGQSLMQAFSAQAIVDLFEAPAATAEAGLAEYVRGVLARMLFGVRGAQEDSVQVALEQAVAGEVQREGGGQYHARGQFALGEGKQGRAKTGDLCIWRGTRDTPEAVVLLELKAADPGAKLDAQGLRAEMLKGGAGPPQVTDKALEQVRGCMAMLRGGDSEEGGERRVAVTGYTVTLWGGGQVLVQRAGTVWAAKESVKKYMAQGSN